MIPIKGYSTFDPLKHCMIGATYGRETFREIKNPKIRGPLQRIADETEEDYQKLESILKEHGVTTYRPNVSLRSEDNPDGNQLTSRPPVSPRDHFAVIGETIYGTDGYRDFYKDLFKQIPKENQFIKDWPFDGGTLMTTAQLCRVGKDLFWDLVTMPDPETNPHVLLLKEKFESEGFRLHISNRGWHGDGGFCVVKPGAIVSIFEMQDYQENFPGYEVCYTENHWTQMEGFTDGWQNFRNKVDDQWWVRGEEENDEFTHHVNTWLTDWVGYVEETIFDVNMLSINQEVIICNNYNKQVFDFFKKHKVEPIIFNFRHRYFWDGGIHCITQDFYREGELTEYITYKAK